MAKEELNSNKINYLIWRYLQESNYRETAVKLQSEWDVRDPQSLDFAPHVNNHALVSMLQSSLLYNEAERLSTQSRRGAAAVPVATGFFGPIAPLSPPLATVDGQENARKRSVDERSQQARQESPVKRTKLSNGYENGIDATSMDVDEAIPPPQAISNGHAYPSPQEVEVERVPTPALRRTIGPSRGTQVEKIAELSTETTYLSLAETSSTKLPVLMNLEWNPRDPKCLATAGENTLARLWMVPSRATSPEIEGHVKQHAFVDLVDEDGYQSTVTEIAWKSDGEVLAVASNDVDFGKINLWGKDGSRVAQFNSLGYPPILCLRWGASDRTLLAMSNTDKKCVISSWATVLRLKPEPEVPELEKPEPEKREPEKLEPESTESTESAKPGPEELKTMRPELVAYDLGPNFDPHDAVWTGKSEFAVCNAKSLLGFTISPEGKISQTRNYNTPESTEPPQFLAYEPHSNLLATGDGNGAIDIWDHSGTRTEVPSHKEAITFVKWQPIPSPAKAPTESVLVSSSDDGTINIWSSRTGFKEPTQTMILKSSVLALAFTPDGAFLAAATNTDVLVWSMADPSSPRARWTKGNEPDWKNPEPDAIEEDVHCLCWDADGKRLAYGANRMIAVIKFMPAVAEIATD